MNMLFLDKNVLKGQTYHYRLRTVDVNGASNCNDTEIVSPRIQ